jgi:hypothetical protein
MVRAFRGVKFQNSLMFLMSFLHSLNASKFKVTANSDWHKKVYKYLKIFLFEAMALQEA